MCRVEEGPCLALGPRESWSRRAPLPPPHWLRDDVAAFAEAAKLAAAGELDAAREGFAALREAEARNWFGRHGKMSCYTRRSSAAMMRVRTATKVVRPRSALALQRRVYVRDHYVCRYCGLPTISKEAREALHRLLGPGVVRWGGTDAERHGTALAAWTQYDHVQPIALGGADDEANLVTSCGCCNYGKDQYSLAELGLDDPRDVPPVESDWDGLVSLVPALRGQLRDSRRSTVPGARRF